VEGGVEGKARASLAAVLGHSFSPSIVQSWQVSCGKELWHTNKIKNEMSNKAECENKKVTATTARGGCQVPVVAGAICFYKQQGSQK